MKACITASGAPAAVGPYSHAVVAGGLVFASGQLGLVPQTGKLAEGLQAQTQQALVNLESVLLAAGAQLSDVVKTTVYVLDMKDFPQVNAIYAQHFGSDFPARSCVQVSALPAGGLVEIDAIAIRAEASAPQTD